MIALPLATPTPDTAPAVASDLVAIVADPTAPPLSRVIAVVLLAAALTMVGYQLAKRMAEAGGLVLPWWLHQVASGAGAVVAAAAGIYALGGDPLDASMWIALAAAPTAWAAHKGTSGLRGGRDD